MKFTCTQSDLSKALSYLSRIAPSRPSHPILANVLIDARDGLKLSATDLSTALELDCEADIIEPGITTVPAALIADVAAKLPSGNITITQQNDQITLDYGFGSYTLPTIDATEYPELNFSEKTPFQVQSRVLSQAIAQCLFAASTEESKAVLTGLYLNGDKTLECAATDGHRLAVATFEGIGKIKALIPAPAMLSLKKLLPSEGYIEMAIDHAQIDFICDGVKFTSRLLDGQYPNYPQLFPKQFDRSVTVERAVLTAALERIGIFSQLKVNMVKLAIDADKGEITVSAEAAQIGSGKEVIPAIVTGDSIQIGFNVKYLLDGLKAIDCPEVLLQISGDVTPMIVEPVSGGFKYLVMPLKVRD